MKASQKIGEGEQAHIKNAEGLVVSFKFAKPGNSASIVAIALVS